MGYNYWEIQSIFKNGKEDIFRYNTRTTFLRALEATQNDSEVLYYAWRQVEFSGFIQK